MKKLLATAILLGLILLIYQYRNQIIEYVAINYIYKNEFNYQVPSKYEKREFSYFTETNSFKPKSKEDILNIIYTNINKGLDNFNFYCSYEYEHCVDDVKYILSDNAFLSNLNNFVSSYNTYSKLNVTINTLGKINITVEKYYDDRIINLVDNKINELIKELITDDMSDYDKIKTIHDYIINNTIYDKEKEQYLNTDTITKYNSNTAYGPLFEGYGICSGYSDLMSLFLDKLNIPNYRISNNDHVWNLVYVDNKWKHIDLTWDDPVTNTGEQVLNYDYFLISTDELYEKDNEKHNFDSKIYLEARNI